MSAPTPEQLAFHQEVKDILDKHQGVIGEIAMAAILSQVAGSVIAIPMVYDNMSPNSALQVIVINARKGVDVGRDIMEAANREATNGPS